jgi:hypothetical protein
MGHENHIDCTRPVRAINVLSCASICCYDTFILDTFPNHIYLRTIGTITADTASNVRDRWVLGLLTGFHDCCSGRLVIEVFEDQVPLAARWFMNRCREGMANSLQGTKVHRLIPEQALFAGVTRG